DFVRCVLLLQRDRQRLAGQLERGSDERGRVAAGSERAQDERGLRGAQLGGDPLLGAERLARAVELDRDGSAVRAGGNEQELRRTDALGHAADGGRGAT